MIPEVSTRYPEVRLADVAAELRREQAARQRTYPDQVQRGRMTQPEADHQLAIVAALLEDVERYHARCIMQRTLEQPRHAFTWHQRRLAITRELEYRGRVYPEWIAKGKLDQAEADKATRRLEALADIYDDGFDWHPRNGKPRILFGTNPTTTAEREAQVEWWDHYRTVMQARGYMASDQKELFA